MKGRIGSRRGEGDTVAKEQGDVARAVVFMYVVLIATTGISGNVSGRVPVARNLAGPAVVFRTGTAGQGDLVIAIAEFQDDSAARDLDAQTALAYGIRKAMPQGPGGRIVLASAAVPGNDAEARAVGQVHSATIVVWGRYTDELIEVSLTPLVDPHAATRTLGRRSAGTSTPVPDIFIEDLAVGPVRWVSLLAVGQVLYSTGRFSDALASIDTALALVETLEPKPDQIAATYAYAGNASYYWGHLPAAITYYERALDICWRECRPGAEALLLGNLGVAYKDLGQVYVEIDRFGSLLALTRGSGYQEDACAQLIYLSDLHRRLQEMPTAVDYLEQATAIAEEISDRRVEGTALTMRGILAEDQGDTARARELWGQALAIYEAIEDPNAARVRGWLAALEE